MSNSRVLPGALVNEITLDGHSLCTKKIKVNNLGGATLTREGLPHPDVDQTTAEEAQTTIDIEFENSGRATEFNPFSLAEAHESIQSVPNYFDSQDAKKGEFSITTKSGCLRLLVPDSQKHLLPNMRCKKVYISLLKSPDRIKIMFDDESANPFRLVLAAQQCDAVVEAGFYTFSFKCVAP